MVTLEPIDQCRKPESFEVCIRKPHRESFGPSEIPGAESAADSIAGQPPDKPQREQRLQTTAAVFSTAVTWLLEVSIGSSE